MRAIDNFNTHFQSFALLLHGVSRNNKFVGAVMCAVCYAHSYCARVRVGSASGNVRSSGADVCDDWLWFVKIEFGLSGVCSARGR